ncbi:MAG: hypothetical protein AAFR64_02480, partial [Pseudomonadota bacterium]
MAILIQNRSKLLLGACPMALAISLTLAPERVRAQAFQANETVVVGAATRFPLDNGTETIVVDTQTTVIDWTPQEDASGNALTFLPDGNIATFESSLDSPEFGVLNRILPSTNGNVVMIDGAVISQYFNTDSSSFETGGTIAFYSPTGIIVGGGATFDVGSLILTSLEPDLTSFVDFNENGGQLQLGTFSRTGPTASVIINPGAQINAPQDGSFFIAAAAEVQMLGQSRVNGSQAFVAGEVVNITFTNGLFDIQIPAGTSETTPIVIDGDVGGPASTGVGDNHIIYAVAKAATDPISMIFRGNLGFDPAVSAGVVNGEVILSANYDVNGRSVQDGSISDGINAIFSRPEDEIDPPPSGNIFLEDFNSSSSLLAIANDKVQVTAFNSNSSVDGNLLLVGRNAAELTATAGNSFTITGDVLVSARAFGVRSSSLIDPTVINAEGGIAFIDAFAGGSLNILGNALVTADAFGGENDVDGDFGSATGGSAQVGSNGGTLEIAGNLTVSANGEGADGGFGFIGAEMRGGLAQVFASQGGVVNLRGAVEITADAFGPSSSSSTGVTASNVFGGQALLNILPDGGSITVDLDAFLSANANGSFSSDTTAGATATGGEVTVAVQDTSSLTLLGALNLAADANGGSNDLGAGGAATGGTARTFVEGGGTVSVAGDFFATASAQGGDGTEGGQGIGGFAGARALVGRIEYLGNASASAIGSGGAAFFGQGGTGGTGLGGTALFQAEGTLTETAELEIGLSANLFATGNGGTGGFGDSQVPAGEGGLGQGGSALAPNVAQPDFLGGAYLLAGADNGTLTVGGTSVVNAGGNGGTGGDAPVNQTGGTGGDGIGGRAFAGVSLFANIDGSVGAGSAQLGTVVIGASGSGGFGGFDGQSSSPTGAGGDGRGGLASLLVTAGQVTTGEVSVTASGDGGSGTNGGNGVGGLATVEGSLEGTASLTGLFLAATGFGSSGDAGLGGTGSGGTAALSISGIDVLITGNASLDSTGFGGSSSVGNGADGTGGTSTLGAIDPDQGSLQIDGNASVRANGVGGSAFGLSGQGGTGQGGTASAISQASSVVQLGSAQFTASGVGGQGQQGGNGTGGTASLEARDISSIITIIEDVPVQNSDTFNDGAILAANGTGANGFGVAADGGNGTGGTVSISALNGGEVALPAAPSQTSLLGAMRLVAQGRGGMSSDGGNGGGGNGGNGEIIADGGTVSMGRTEFSVAATGGSGQAGNTNSDAFGGSAFGGSRAITISNGGVLNADLPLGFAGAIGGNGAGAGDGGFAAGGNSSVSVTDGTLNIFGDLTVASNSTGGNGGSSGNGGTATDGEARFDASNSTLTFTAPPGGQSTLLVSSVNQGGSGSSQGGDAEGGDVIV